MKTLRTLVVCNVALVMLCSAVACHRSYYRRQADADASRLIEEKSLDPHWSLPGYTIEVDPSSRMFDPFSQDHPPMPPDDPSAAEFMREVDGKPGFPHWHANGDTPYVENPEWKYMLPVDKDGKLIVDIERAVDLALVHSPDYQRQLENLYLSALEVSLERFDFETQFFLPFGSSFQTNSNLAKKLNPPPTPFLEKTRQTSVGINTIPSENPGNLRKAGIAGSTLIIRLANSIVWQLSGTDSTVGIGTLSAELTQPLLRAAGRDVVLEVLTAAERSLLYNVRRLERFRRGYMQRIVAGINNGENVSINSGEIGQIANVSSNAGGVLSLLQTQQSIRIQEANIASQRNLLEQFEEYYNFQRIDLLQLKQFKRSVYNAQSALLSDQAGYQTSLDDFKITLGLPPDIELNIEDPLLDKFVLIDQKISVRQNEVRELRKTASQIFLSITESIALSLKNLKAARDKITSAGGDPETDLSWTDNDIVFDELMRDRIRLVREILQKIEPIYDNILEVDIPQTEKDIQRLKNSLGRRNQSLVKLNQKYFDEARDPSKIPVIEPEVLELEQLETVVSDRLIELNGGTRINDQDQEEIVIGAKANILAARNRLRELLRKWDLILANDGKLPLSELDKESLKTELGPEGIASLREAIKTRAGTIRSLISEPGPEILTEINNLIIDVSLIQASARVDSLTLPIVEIDWQEALELARSNRRDWMNARARLVDQWRNIEVIADTLESQLNLTINGEVPTRVNQPVNLDFGSGRLRMGLQFDAPITRLAERNDYRTALIAYQRTKRTFYQYEDRISAQLREIIRLLEVSKLNFEISRVLVKNSVDEVQLASYNLVRPPAPGSTGSRVGDQTANNLIRALSGLLNNQNSLIRNWVQYEVLRRQLDFNMGTMQLNESGYWIDPIEITPETIQRQLSGENAPEFDQPPAKENDDNTAPLDSLPPISRRNSPNQFSRTSNFRQDNRSTFPNWEDNRVNTDTAFRNGAPRSASSSDVPQTTQPNPPSTDSLYSNFDSDLRRAQTSSLDTSIERPTSNMANLPAGKKVVERQASESANRFRRNSDENRRSSRIGPFPFLVK